MADREEDRRQEERAHGNHAKGSVVQNMAAMCTGMTHCTATVMRSGIHIMATIMTVSTVETTDQQQAAGTSQWQGHRRRPWGQQRPSTSGDPVLGCLQSLSDRLTDLEESRSVLAAPVQLAHGSTSDSDCVDDQQQTDKLGQFLDGEFSPTPDQQVGD